MLKNELTMNNQMFCRIGSVKISEKTKNSNKTNYIHFNEHKKH